jgi:hypothetical protein
MSSMLVCFSPELLLKKLTRGLAYAADGYARIKGMSALITTFGVGKERPHRWS